MNRSLRIKWLLAAILFVLVLVALSLQLSKSETPKPSQQLISQANAPAAIMEGMRASEFRQGVKRWDLIAVRAEYDKVRDHTVLIDVTLLAADKKPMGAVKLVAPKAEFMNASKNLRLPMGVSGTGDRCMRLSAGQALFTNSSSLLTARGQVRYKDELLQVEGDEMVFDLETRNLRIKRNVSATIHPRGDNR